MRHNPFSAEHRFADRRDAGRALGDALTPLVADIPRRNLIVLGLARGGVVVAAEVAAILGAELDACVVRKIGSPMQPELAIGAVAPGAVRVLNQALISDLNLSEASVDHLAKSIEETRQRLDAQLRDGRDAPNLDGKTVLLIDDGLATGASMRAALEFARQSAETAIIGVPIASPEVVESFEALGVQTISLVTTRKLRSVGQWYERFDEVSSGVAHAILTGTATV